MSKSEEQSNTDLADKLVTPKRLYFVDGVAGGVEASDAVEAVKLAKKRAAKQVTNSEDNK